MSPFGKRRFTFVSPFKCRKTYTKQLTKLYLLEGRRS
nr:MAG TPA: hypothetical protein [Caudoviricetes sp.]